MHMCMYVFTHICMCVCVLQNSPELDEEGYSIRPEEPGYILFFFNFLNLCCLRNQEAKFRSHKGNEITKATILSLTGE